MEYKLPNTSTVYRYKASAVSPLIALDGFPFFYPGYPSSLPDVIELEFDERGMGNHILGFTNGHVIVRRKNLGLLKDFVQFHEEEHVKDMDANELEVDKRAFRRLSSLTNDNKIEKAIELLEKRWGNELAEQLFAL